MWLPWRHRSVLEKPETVQDPELSRLWDRIEEAYQWHDSGSRSWSFLYNSCFGLATVASTLVTFLSGHKVEAGDWAFDGTLLGILSIVAAVLTAIGGFGGFERKWRANRTARSRLWLLLTEIETAKLTTPDLNARLSRIIEEEDAGVLGPAASSATNPSHDGADKNKDADKHKDADKKKKEKET
jgi:hypothetical protein